MAFLTIAEAVKKYGKSESTYRRLILDVRKGGDRRKRILIQPSEEEIKESRQSGQQYTYTIAEELIERDVLGKDPQLGSKPSAGETSAQQADLRGLLEKMEQRHEKELSRMESQLAAEKQEKKELLEYAHKDKELFAQAAQSLTQVLALPGIADATRAGNETNTAGMSSDVSPKQGSEQSTSLEQEREPSAPSRLLRRIFRRKR